ncbi:MAG: ABC transporter ATP-binding protein, partial [Chloroflexales bacterium]|nr:ABC transporter ATP-binding protein [Chloroflexales bacterium]
MNKEFKRYRELLQRYFWPQRMQVGLLIGLILLDNALQLFGPNLLSRFVDLAVHTTTTSTQLQTIAGVYLITMIFRQGASMAATYVGETAGWRAANRLRADLARHTIALDMSYHKQQTPGIMIERIDGEMMLMFIMLSALILTTLRNVAVPYWEAGREAAAQLFSFLEERLAGIEDIRGLGSSAHVLKRLDVLMATKNRYDILGHVYGGVTWIVPLALAAILTILILGFGSWLYLAGQISIGLIVMTLLYGEMVVWPIRAIAQEIDKLQQASAGILRVVDLMSKKSRLVDGTEALSAVVPAVTFDHVTFAYPDGESVEAPVLTDVSFHIPAGAVVGLLGRTGSGKSTLIRLLFRLYDVTSGAIKIGDHALPEYQLAALRSRVGLVTQDVQLFYATVRDNLTFFNRAISDDKLIDA